MNLRGLNPHPTVTMKVDKEISIRKAQTGDIAIIKDILFGALKEYGIAIPDNFSVSDIDSINFRDSRERVFVLQKRDMVIGFMALRPVDNDCMELKRLYLISSERGKGLGAHLLNCAVDHAKNSGYQIVRLETTSRFKAAVSLYKKFGFKVIDKVEKAPGHDLAFEKNLTS